MGGERLQPVRHEVRSVLQPVHQTLERLVSEWRGGGGGGGWSEVRGVLEEITGIHGGGSWKRSRSSGVRFGGRAGGSLTCESPAGSDASAAASFFFTMVRFVRCPRGGKLERLLLSLDFWATTGQELNSYSINKKYRFQLERNFPYLRYYESIINCRLVEIKRNFN